MTGSPRSRLPSEAAYRLLYRPSAVPKKPPPREATSGRKPPHQREDSPARNEASPAPKRGLPDPKENSLPSKLLNSATWTVLRALVLRHRPPVADLTSAFQANLALTHGAAVRAI